jgi:16S rRNA (adenine1518-N6/adenine1519-N6)-dimethyltransferase
MKLSEMKHLLATGDIRLTRSLGQNFLHDGNQLQRIVAAARLTSSDSILEIGPGLGPLTELLIAQAGKVLAIEKDARLVKLLRQRFSTVIQSNVLQLVHGDALDYLKRGPHLWTGWKLVANLPYSVASPILVELALAAHGPELLVATLQLEVARRLMARPGTADYGLLTLLVQLHYVPRQWFKIPAGCFFPEPEVDSACVCLERRTQPLLESTQQECFVQILKRGFSQRRKTLLKLLKEDWPADALPVAFSRLGLSAQARAESLSLEDFCRLTCSLSRHQVLPTSHLRNNE